MAIHRFQTSDGKIHRVEAPTRGEAERELNRALGIKPNPVADFGRSVASGLREGAANLADTVGQSNPFGQMTGALQTAANVTNLFQGKTTGATMAAPVSNQSRAAAKDAYAPQTTAGEYGRTFGQMAPNAVAPGSIAARAANVFAPAIASETFGQVARASGADKTGEAVARGFGALSGAGVASLRPQNMFTRRGAPTPEQTLGVRARQDPVQMRQRADEMRAAGLDPTLTDVVDDAGRGAIRAAANAPTPGRQAANDFSRNRTNNLPSRISTQTRRTVSADPRSPDQIRAEMVAQRSANADQAFGAVRGDRVQLSPEGVQALRSDYGREAIAEAARRERDPEIRAALNRLSTDALDAPSTEITVGMADRISRVLLGRAGDAGGDNDLRGILTSLGRSVREPTASASPGYANALEGYAADSRLTEAAGVGEGFMQRNTDEFAAQAARLSPEERQLALAAARRAVERGTGENPSTAAGVARRLADAPEQQARNAALMGQPRANLFQGAMREEAQAVDNANAIAPRAGSSTFLNAADDNAFVRGARQVAAGVGELMRGRFGDLGFRIYENWARRGMNDAQVEQLVRVAIDPAQTNAAIAAIAQRLEPVQRQEFLSLRNAALTGALATTGAARSTPEQ